MQSPASRRAGRIISIISPMGGDGRTTLCANVCVALARLGKQTVAVDGDLVHRSLSRVMGLEFSLGDVMEEACGLSEACIPCRDVPGLQLFPIARHVQGIAVMENMKPNPEIAGKACDELQSLGDLVVIDSPPGCAGRLATTTSAEEVIVVVMPMWHTIHAAKRIIEAAKLLGKRSMRPVINQMQPEENRYRDDRPDVDGILEILQLELLGIVPQDDCVAASGYRGKFAVLNPESPAGQEYQNIARRLLGEEVPFNTLKS